MKILNSRGKIVYTVDKNLEGLGESNVNNRI